MPAHEVRKHTYDFGLEITPLGERYDGFVGILDREPV